MHEPLQENGTVKLWILPQTRQGPPPEEAANAFAFLEQCGDLVRQILLESAADWYSENDLVEDDDFLPGEDEIDPERVARHLEVVGVHFLSPHRDGFSYVGFKCRCDWSDAGFGLLLHIDRVVKVGDHEVATDHHAAKDDAEGRRP